MGRKSVLWLLLAANIIGSVGFLLWSSRPRVCVDHSDSYTGSLVLS